MSRIISAIGMPLLYNLSEVLRGDPISLSFYLYLYPYDNSILEKTENGIQIGNKIINRLLDMVKTNPAASSISILPALVFVMN